MGNPYTSVSVTSYNSNPPPDDGSQVANNRVQWSTHKTKLGDPLKTAIESINTNVNTAVSKLLGGGGITSTATNYTVTASDQGKLVKVTASATITTPDATSVGSPFVFSIVNEHTSSITVDGSGSQTIDGSDTITVAPKGGVTLNTDGTNWFTSGQNFTLPYPPGHLYGGTLSNAADATNDIQFEACKCRDSSDAQNLVTASALIKQLDASWAAGTDAGGRSSAGLADGTWHCFVIGKTDGTTDAFFHNAVDPSAVLPSGYTLYRRVGSIVRKAASILAFSQYGDEFLLNATLSAFDQDPGTTSAFLITLDVPTGIKVLAKINALVDTQSALLSSPDASDQTPSSTANPFLNLVAASARDACPMTIRTNTSAQIRARVLDGGSNCPLRVSVAGWVDSRGKDN